MLPMACLSPITRWWSPQSLDMKTDLPSSLCPVIWRMTRLRPATGHSVVTVPSPPRGVDEVAIGTVVC